MLPYRGPKIIELSGQKELSTTNSWIRTNQKSAVNLKNLELVQMIVLLLAVAHQTVKMEMHMTSFPNIREEKCVKIKQKLHTPMDMEENAVIESIEVKNKIDINDVEILR